MWLNSIKKKSDPSNNTASQPQNINRESIKQAQATSQFNEAVKEMKEISKSSGDSADNMEKLTIIIAILTVASVLISVMSLTITSAKVVAPAAPDAMIYFAWGVSLFTGCFCFWIVLSILERGKYIPKDPHLSHIKRYTKYCCSRFIATIETDILLIVVGITFGLLSYTTYVTQDFSVIQNSCIFGISLSALVSLTIALWCIKKENHYRFHAVNFAGVIPLMIILFLKIPSIETILVLILLVYCIVLGLVSLINLIRRVNLFVVNKSTLKYWYEYESDKSHTGILVVIDPHRFGDLADDGVKHLARHYMNDLKQSYRVYFCFKKEHVMNILAKDTVNDILLLEYPAENFVTRLVKRIWRCIMMMFDGCCQNHNNCGNLIYSEMDYINSGLADSKFHGKTFDQILYSKNKVKSLIHDWKNEQDSLED
ncbi:MAG: hypothetical protein WC248_06785 [Candidatus Methanomethylophilaceae archaeon]|jgi:hypothetical protein